jgi:hypothetical protein
VIDLGGIVFYMAVAYLAGDLAGWTLVRFMHRVARRGRS